MNKKKSYRPLLKKQRRPEKQSEDVPDSSCGQRSLAGYSPWGHKDLDQTKQLKWTWTIIIYQALW